MLRKLLVSATTVALAASTGFGLLGDAAAEAAMVGSCDDESGLCLEASKGAKWEPDQTASEKDRDKRSKSNPGNLSLEIDGGRGSLFLNGRYAGTAPLEGIDVPAGRNDLQVRDGAEVLASGVLTVPGGAELAITVRHD